MQRDQVTELLAEHTKRYPALAGWLKSNAGQLEVWYEQLAYVQLPDALTASRRLYERDDQPRGYSRHPAIVRAIAGEIAAERTSPSGDDNSAHCGKCYDTGWVSVLSPASLTAVHWSVQGRDTPPEGAEHGVKDIHTREAITILRRRSLRWCSIICQCERGDVVARAKRKTPVARYAPRHALIEYDECAMRSLTQQVDLWDAAAELLVERAGEIQPPMVSVDDWEG